MHIESKQTLGRLNENPNLQLSDENIQEVHCEKLLGVNKLDHSMSWSEHVSSVTSRSRLRITSAYPSIFTNIWTPEI